MSAAQIATERARISNDLLLAQQLAAAWPTSETAQLVTNIASVQSAHNQATAILGDAPIARAAAMAMLMPLEAKYNTLLAQKPSSTANVGGGASGVPSWVWVAGIAGAALIFLRPRLAPSRSASWGRRYA